VESKIINISTGICDYGQATVALCADGSVWSLDRRNKWHAINGPHKTAQKNGEAPETIDNNDRDAICPEHESGLMCRLFNKESYRCGGQPCIIRANYTRA